MTVEPSCPATPSGSGSGSGSVPIRSQGDQHGDERPSDDEVLDHQAPGGAGQPYDGGDGGEFVAHHDGVCGLQGEGAAA